MSLTRIKGGPDVPTDREIDAAMAAYAAKDDEVEGVESGKARRLCWAAALDAAAQERTRQIQGYRRRANK